MTKLQMFLPFLFVAAPPLRCSMGGGAGGCDAALVLAKPALHWEEELPVGKGRLGCQETSVIEAPGGECRAVKLTAGRGHL